LALCACPEAEAPPALNDAGSQPLDATVLTDSGWLGDAGNSRPDAAEIIEPCPEDARIEIAGSSIDWNWWSGDELPNELLNIEVSDRRCENLHVSSDADWLYASLDAANSRLFLQLVPQQLRSGKHRALVQISSVAGRPSAAEISVNLSALTRIEPNQPHVLVIGLDGLRADALHLAETPEIDALARRGSSSYTASTQLSAATSSAPGWHSIFTGVEPSKHGVRSNGNYQNIERGFPTFFKRAADELGLNSAAVVHWGPLLDSHIEETSLHFSARGLDSEVKQAMIEHLHSGESQVHYVHFDDPDHAGHATGFSAYNPEYIAAVEGNDSMIGELVEAILERPNINAEDWLIVVTSDHGGSGRSHGALNLEMQRIPLIVSGPTAQRRRLEGGSHLDVHPTVMAHLGLDAEESWSLDGSVFGIASNEELNCADGFDDDQDGLIDCDDSDCDSAEACLPIENICPSDSAGSRLGWQVYTSSLQGAVARLNPSCKAQSGRERTVTWRAQRSSRFVFNSIASRGDTLLWARSSCLGEELACNDNIYDTVRNDVPYNIQSLITVDLTEGQQIILGLDEAERDAVQQIQLNVHDLGLACDEAPIANGLGTALSEGNNEAASTRFSPSCAGMGRDSVLLWTAPNDGNFRFDTDGSAVDTVLALFSPDCMNELACDDDGGRGYASLLTRQLQQGQRLAIVLGGFRGRSGNWQLNITALEN
jgi:hypothetical protein